MNKTTNVTKLLNRLVETKAETLKLGMDVHARDVVVAVQVDGSRPQRPQKMTAAEVVVLVRGLVAAGRQVYTCYEAGPCGYGLHRELLAAGATNYVVVPEVLGGARQQKTDQFDALALTDRLDRYGPTRKGQVAEIDFMLSAALPATS
jgi:transposase